MSTNFFIRAYVALLALVLLASIAVDGTSRYGECAVAVLALLYLFLDLREGLQALARAEEAALAATRDTHAAGRP